MSRVFPADKENNKWIVRMSMGKRITSSTVVHSNQQRNLSIRKTSPKKKQSTEKWKEEILNFIGETKKQVDKEARNAIEMVEKWQLDTCARLDIVQQHVFSTSHEIILPLRESLFQIVDYQVTPISLVQTEINHSEKPVDQAVVNNSSENNASTKASDGKTVICPEKSSNRPVEPVKSMPILTDETNADDNLETLKPQKVEKLVGKKIEKRRQSDTHYSPLNEIFDVPVRKKSNAFHSSVLAMSNRSPNEQPQPKKIRTEEVQLATSSKSPKPLAVLDKDKKVDNNSNGKQNKNPEKSAIFQKFLETKKLVEEREKMKAQQVVANGENAIQSTPKV